MTTQAIDGLLSRAATEHITVIALTDEEITALDGPEVEQVAPRPWYDAQDAATQETAYQVALRGLIARGIVIPEQPGEGDDVVLHLSDDLRTMLALRQTPDRIVLAERRMADQVRIRVLYVHSEGVVVEEDVTEGGLHTLSVGPIGLLSTRLAEFCDPFGVACERPALGPRMLPLADVAGGAGQEIFSQSRVVTQISRHALDDAGQVAEERITIYAPADRVVAAEPAQAGENGMLALSDLDPAGLRRRILHLLGS